MSQNLANDFKILRNSVSLETISDRDLALLFKDHNYDVVQSMLAIEEKYFNNVPYTIEKSKGHEVISQLRAIANERDEIFTKVQKRSS